jgi:hypothetical protein
MNLKYDSKTEIIYVDTNNNVLRIKNFDYKEVNFVIEPQIIFDHEIKIIYVKFLVEKMYIKI